MGEIGLEPAAGDEAENHGGEGGYKTECRVTAAVVEERFFAREQIEEPSIERPGEIGVLVPMRGESLQMMRPVRRHARGHPIKFDRAGVQGERGPIAKHDDDE